MAAAVDSSPSQLCAAAEQALLLSDFSNAEAHARRCLASSSMPAAVQERALIVVVQALFEQDRASAARQLLSDCYPRLEDVPPNALLLWLALAVDSQHGDEAKQAMPALLSSCQPGSAAGWSRAQYLTLLHLYMFEALLPERRDVAGVVRWVQATELPLEADERQLLLDELAAQQAAQQAQQAQQAAQQAAHAAPTPPGSQLTPGTAPGAPAAVQASAGGAERIGHSAHMQSHGRKPAADQLTDRTGTAAAAAAAAAPAGPVAQAPKHMRRQQREPEIVPAPDEPSSAAGSSGSGGSGSGEASSSVQAGIEWLCQAQQQAVQAAATFLRPLLGHSPAEEQGNRGAPAAQQLSPDPLQLAGGTVLGAVLLYALYAERQSIRRGVRRARRTLTDGTLQLLRMAFSLSINPLATGSSLAA